MRSTWKVLGAAASLVLVPQMVAADTTIEEQMELIQQRMSQLEDQLQATNDDLQAANTRVEEQQAVLDDAGIGEDGAVSALSSFLTETDFYGWVNTSYTQGFRGDSGSALGQNFPPLFFHQDNMGFAVNQVWFGMDHASTEESRAGFHVDMLFGKDANLAGRGNFFDFDGDGVVDPGEIFGTSDNSFELFTAYVTYLAPIGNGIEFQGGKLPTLNGAEVVNTTQNFNITRGLVWGLQPVNTTGLLVKTDLGAGFSTTMGVLNDVYVPGADGNLDKSFTGQVAWSNDMFGAAVTGNWGYSGSSTTMNRALVDAVLTADPLDNLSLWLNYDWVGNFDDFGPTAQTHGIALAGRYGITDATGVAVRGEYVYLNDASGALLGADDGWSVTGTVDHHLTDDLLVRLEYRYDGNMNAIFFGANNNGIPRHKDQHVIIVDATYEF